MRVQPHSGRQGRAAVVSSSTQSRGCFLRSAVLRIVRVIRISHQGGRVKPAHSTTLSLTNTMSVTLTVWLVLCRACTSALQKVQSRTFGPVRVHTEPWTPPQPRSECWGAHTSPCCVPPSLQTLRTASSLSRHVPSQVAAVASGRERPSPHDGRGAARTCRVHGSSRNSWPRLAQSQPSTLLRLRVL